MSKIGLLPILAIIPCVTPQVHHATEFEMESKFSNAIQETAVKKAMDQAKSVGASGHKSLRILTRVPIGITVIDDH